MKRQAFTYIHNNNNLHWLGISFSLSFSAMYYFILQYIISLSLYINLSLEDIKLKGVCVTSFKPRSTKRTCFGLICFVFSNAGGSRLKQEAQHLSKAWTGSDCWSWNSNVSDSRALPWQTRALSPWSAGLGEIASCCTLTLDQLPNLSASS